MHRSTRAAQHLVFFISVLKVHSSSLVLYLHKVQGLKQRLWCPDFSYISHSATQLPKFSLFSKQPRLQRGSSNVVYHFVAVWLLTYLCGWCLGDSARLNLSVLPLYLCLCRGRAHGVCCGCSVCPCPRPQPHDRSAFACVCVDIHEAPGRRCRWTDGLGTNMDGYMHMHKFTLRAN